MARPRVGGHPVEAQCSRLSRSFRQACWKPIRQVRRYASAVLELGTREHQRIVNVLSANRKLSRNRLRGNRSHISSKPTWGSRRRESYLANNFRVATSTGSNFPSPVGHVRVGLS
jgi:hypothetical protein